MVKKSLLSNHLQGIFCKLNCRGERPLAPTRRNLKRCFGLAIYFLLIIMSSLLPSLAQEPASATITYTPSAETFPNPERGFRFSAEINSNASFTTYYEALGIALVHAYIRLDNYREQDLPQTFLDELDVGFANMRTSGVKAVIRFAYNFGPYPDSEPDSSKQQILRHIEQLAPILQKNADVIAWMQAGFIGAWGEWHTSTNGLDNLADKQEILFAMLEALPVSRMVQVRYPSDMIEMFPEPLTAEQAFGKSKQARVGFHNDCFLSSDTDVGTYEKSGEMTLERDQAYLANLSRFTPSGGETCAVYPPRTDCDSALREMELLHFTELNQSYHAGVIRAWKRQGCFEEIQNRLGYRLVLKSATLNQQVRPGGLLEVHVELENQGFASLVNARSLVLVLDGPQRHEVTLPIDPRTWESGTSSFTVSLHIPSEISQGDYKLALWLPDAYETLRDNPRYAVRFANETVWDAENAYNVLAEVSVDSSAQGNSEEDIETLEVISFESVAPSTALAEGAEPVVTESTQIVEGDNEPSGTSTNESSSDKATTEMTQQKRRPAENGPDLIATALTELLSIDGELSEWSDFPCVKIDANEQLTLGADTWTGADDLSATACYAWDKENIYVAFDVVDDTIVQKNKGSSLWRGDHIELWFDTQLQQDFDDAVASDDDFQLGLSPGDFADVPPDIFIWQPSVPRKNYEGFIDYAVQQTVTGYSAEMRIPASVLAGLELIPGTIIGATFDPSDTDTSGSSEQETMLSTAPKTQWGVPTLWNNLILQGEPTVSVTSSQAETNDTADALRKLSNIQDLKPSNVASDVTAIIGYSFDPGDVTKPVTAEVLEQARETVRQAAAEGALWLDADTGITNYTDNFLNDPSISFYPLVTAIIDEAHKNNIKVFFYFSGAEIETANYSQRPETSIEKIHPDWMQIDQFGKPMAFVPGEVQAFWLGPDDADAWANPLAPGFREEIMKRAEAVAAAGADGIYVDVPYYFIYDNRWADFSELSAQAFKAATGFDLPRNLEADGRAFFEWLEWRNNVWAGYFAEMRERVKGANPNTHIMVEEWPAASSSGILETGYDTMIADSAIDIAAHEYGHKQDEGGAIAYDLSDWQNTRDIYKWYQGMNRTNWCLCYATSASDSKAIAAITFAHQLSFWETKAPTMLDESTGTQWRKELLAWIAKHAQVYNGAQPIAEVAVVYSNQTRNQTFGSSLESLLETQHALDEAGIPYVVITELNISRIHDFAYVIFPDVIYATDAVQTEVAKYQGKLILVGDSLTKDTFGENDLTPSVTSISVQEAATSITTTPIKIEGAEGLFVELFRKDEALQIRVFDPNLDESFEAAPKTIMLSFNWQGDLKKVEALEFMGEAISLTVQRQGDTVSLEVPVTLFTTVMIE
jgi:Domain of unknown function (DUF4832)/Domain of unknown function (DUF4874)/Carbohydrate family 9 binding domain-like/Glycosyl hydrolase-like 10